jgi:hypothetical protein
VLVDAPSKILRAIMVAHCLSGHLFEHFLFLINSHSYT